MNAVCRTLTFAAALALCQFKLALASNADLDSGAGMSASPAVLQENAICDAVDSNEYSHITELTQQGRASPLGMDDYRDTLCAWKKLRSRWKSGAQLPSRGLIAFASISDTLVQYAANGHDVDPEFRDSIGVVLRSLAELPEPEAQKEALLALGVQDAEGNAAFVEQVAQRASSPMVLAMAAFSLATMCQREAGEAIARMEFSSDIVWRSHAQKSREDRAQLLATRWCRREGRVWN